MWLAALARSASDAGFPAAGAASDDDEHGAAGGAGAVAGGSYTRSYAGRRLAPLVPITYNRPRLWIKPAFIRAASTRTFTSDSHGEHHEDLGFWRKYIFSTDHKVIGIQYGITALLFLLFGFFLMMMMRWQIAYPGKPIPLIGPWLGQDRAPMGDHAAGPLQPLGAMHGTIMVFLGVVPLAVGGFGNYVVPLQIGAPDMAFPRSTWRATRCISSAA